MKKSGIILLVIVVLAFFGFFYFSNIDVVFSPDDPHLRPSRVESIGVDSGGQTYDIRDVVGIVGKRGTSGISDSEVPEGQECLLVDDEPLGRNLVNTDLYFSMSGPPSNPETLCRAHYVELDIYDSIIEIAREECEDSYDNHQEVITSYYNGERSCPENSVCDGFYVSQNTPCIDVIPGDGLIVVHDGVWIDTWYGTRYYRFTCSFTQLARFEAHVTYGCSGPI